MASATASAIPLRTVASGTATLAPSAGRSRRRAAGSPNLGAATTATENGYNEPPMELELGTVLPIEWTSQHACGPNDKTSCEIVLQYGCDATLAANGMPGLRDGTTTGCPNNGDQCPPQVDLKISGHGLS